MAIWTEGDMERRRYGQKAIWKEGDMDRRRYGQKERAHESVKGGIGTVQP
jgi:hypothetical protein